MKQSQRLFALVAAVLLVACQSPVSTSSHVGSLSWHLPYQDSGARVLVDAPSPTIFPPDLLGIIESYVVRILDGSTEVAAQTVAGGSPSVTFDAVAPGTYTLEAQAWVEGIQVASGQTSVTVVADTQTTVSTLVLVPASAGSGNYSVTLALDPQMEALFSLGRLTVQMSRLDYDGGALVGSPIPLGTYLGSPDPTVADLASPNLLVRNYADLYWHPVPGGNYLLEVRVLQDPFPATPSWRTVATYLVQVYPHFMSSNSTPAVVDDDLLGTPPLQPSGLRLERSTDGRVFVGWDIPTVSSNISYYQVGYGDWGDASPFAALPLVTGEPTRVTAPTRVGTRYQLELDQSDPTWPGSEFYRLFLRAVTGEFAPTDWAFVDLEQSAAAITKSVSSLRFWDLEPATDYVLEKRRTSDDSLIAKRPFTTGADPDSVTLSFPGFTVANGERLVLVEKMPDGTIISTNIEFPETSYLPDTPLFLFPGVHDPSKGAQPVWVALGDPDLGDAQLVPAVAPTGVSLDWETTEVTWSTSYALDTPYLVPTGWKVETDLSPTPAEQILTIETGTFDYYFQWSPPNDQITRYRVRPVFEYAFNAETYRFFGPPSAWQEDDWEAPTIQVALPEKYTAINQITEPLVVDFWFSDHAGGGASDAPTALALGLWNEVGGLVRQSLWTEADPASGGFVVDGNHVTWTSGPEGGNWSLELLPGGSYVLEIVVEDAISNSASRYIPLSFTGGSK